jgi:hypothetical protein
LPPRRARLPIPPLLRALPEPVRLLPDPLLARALPPLARLLPEPMLLDPLERTLPPPLELRARPIDVLERASLPPLARLPLRLAEPIDVRLSDALFPGSRPAVERARSATERSGSERISGGPERIIRVLLCVERLLASLRDGGSTADPMERRPTAFDRLSGTARRAVSSRAVGGVADRSMGRRPIVWPSVDRARSPADRDSRLWPVELARSFVEVAGGEITRARVSDRSLSRVSVSERSIARRPMPLPFERRGSAVTSVLVALSARRAMPLLLPFDRRGSTVVSVLVAVSARRTTSLALRVRVGSVLVVAVPLPRPASPGQTGMR